jgi:hypothetical protein
MENWGPLSKTTIRRDRRTAVGAYAGFHRIEDLTAIRTAIFFHSNYLFFMNVYGIFPFSASDLMLS